MNHSDPEKRKLRSGMPLSLCVDLSGLLLRASPEDPFRRGERAHDTKCYTHNRGWIRLPIQKDHGY